MKRALHVSIWAGFLLFVNCGLPSCRTHESVFSRGGLLTAGDDKLSSTTVTPHLGAPIQPGRCLLWCGTFQLAWNEACALTGGDLRFRGEPPMVAELNRKAFTREHIDDGSHVSLAGFVRDGIHARIRTALAQTFKGQATPKYIPSRRLTPRPQDFVAYSYLFKHLEFPQPFEQLDEGMDFAGTKVRCFGMGEYKPGHAELYGQVSILDYTDTDNFVVELRTKSTGDRLILAKAAPATTLGETVAAVNRRVAGAKPAGMQLGDVLKVPKLNFDLTRRYRELEGLGLLTRNPAIAKDLIILSAVQNIRFQMDEKGVRLRSESHVAIGCSAGPPPPPHNMIFDKPFLILMQRADADVPYFALWVGSAELLVKP